MLNSNSQIKAISKRYTLTDGAIHKTTLTKNKHTAILCSPRTHYELGRDNPISKGDRTPQSLAVFLCPSFLKPTLCRLSNIMMGLFGQSLRLVAPLRDIVTPSNPVANAVTSISVGNPILSKGITA
jgi:hypothetical protein